MLSLCPNDSRMSYLYSTKLTLPLAIPLEFLAQLVQQTPPQSFPVLAQWQRQSHAFSVWLFYLWQSSRNTILTGAPCQISPLQSLPSWANARGKSFPLQRLQLLCAPSP